jgi:hypothetical protein
VGFTVVKIKKHEVIKFDTYYQFYLGYEMIRGFYAGEALEV